MTFVIKLYERLHQCGFAGGAVVVGGVILRVFQRWIASHISGWVRCSESTALTPYPPRMFRPGWD